MLILFLLPLEIVLLRLAVQAAEQTQPFNPPWKYENMSDWTTEGRLRKTPAPPEAEEKKDEVPVSWCTKERDWERDPDGGIGSRRLSITEATYADGTKVIYSYYDHHDPFGGSTTRSTNGWEIITPNGTKVSYHLHSYDVSDETKRQLRALGVDWHGPWALVSEPGGRVYYRKWDVDLKQFDPAPRSSPPAPPSQPAGTPGPSQQPAPNPQPSQTPSPNPAPPQDRGSSLPPSSFNRLATVTYKPRPVGSFEASRNPSNPPTPMLTFAHQPGRKIRYAHISRNLGSFRGEGPPVGTLRTPAPLSVTGTMERPPAPQLQTQTRAAPEAINVKIVTYGDPPAEVFIHLDPGPQSTPEQIVTGTPVITWTPEDGEGPKTHTGTPGGIPVIFYPPGIPMTGGPGQPPITTGEPVKQPPVTTGGPAGQPPPTTGTGVPSGQPPVTGTPIIGIPIMPGTTIHVGWGWAHTSIGSSGIENCVNPAGTGSRASGPPQTANVPQLPSEPAGSSAPKQECTWVTVPRDDVPDFAEMLRQKQT